MITIFQDDLFLKTVLKSIDDSGEIECTLRGANGRRLDELYLNESEGIVLGRLTNPIKLPNWAVPGTIFKCNLRGIQMSLKLKATVPSRITDIDDLLGQKIVLDFKSVTKFQDD